MNTQYRKNLKAVLEASKNYIDKRIDDLQWELGTYDLSVETNTDTAHIKQLPSGTIQTTVSKVEGVGYKVNQLINYTNFSVTSKDGITLTNNNNGSITVSGTLEATSTIFNIIQSSALIPLVNGVKYAIGISGCKNPSKVDFFSNYAQSYGTNGNVYDVFTSQYSSGTWWNIRVTGEIGDVINETIYPQIFNLTADFGAGNEPSTESDCATAYLQRGINIYEYTPQQSSIKNNAFTGVTSKDSSNNVIDTRTIDLTTIKDSNNVSLFPSGKLMGNSSVADFITPYNQESRWNEVKLKDLTWTYDGTRFRADYPNIKDAVNEGTPPNFIINGYNVLSRNDYANSDMCITVSYNGLAFLIKDSRYTDVTAFTTHFTNDDVIQYERATYLTSNTDLTSLTKINAQSNGTITLNNTDNVDMPNTIKSLKEVAK